MMSELQKADEKNVLAIREESYTTNTKVPQKILDEEEYLDVLESIIQRDFFPELSKLQLRAQYIEALELNDLEKLRDIQLQLEKGTPLNKRRATARETPRGFDDVAGIPRASTTYLEEAVTDEKANDSTLSLDAFLAKNTSEDNASFEKIMELTRKKHREKYSWLFQKVKEQEEKQEARLALPSSQIMQIEAANNRPGNVETWTYKPRNALMYTPEGVDLSLKEYIEAKGKHRQEIVHANTRFADDPFDSYASKAAMIGAVKEHSDLQKAVGKIGVDGKLEQSSLNPAVRGYGFVATPSPAPGVDASPLMTWGELEGTPLRIDGTPSHISGPSFKIPEPPRREQIAHSLAENASKQHREKRKKAFAAATASLLSPKFSPRRALTSERLGFLSPAAQKLVKAKMSVGVDKSLRSSYSPSPLRVSGLTLSPKVGTPGSVKSSVRSSARSRTPGSGRADTSITDDLLNLPKT